MPNIIQHKRSSTPGAVPLATGLSQGELGINIGDGKLYTKNSSNAIINLGVSSISGTSITPSSGNFTQSLQLNGTGVSVSGHTHVSSNITNFNSSVSGLLPVGTLNYVSKFGTGGSGLSNSLIFDNGTNAGIGTSSPAARLDIRDNGGSTDYELLRIGNNSNAADVGMRIGFWDDASGSYWGKSTGAITVRRVSSGSAGTMLFTTRDSQTTESVKMSILNGNVGIGTTTPAELLTVYGDSKYLYLQAQNNSGSAGIKFGNTSARQQMYIEGTSNDLVVDSMNGGVTESIRIGYNTGAVTINESGSDLDFRVEGDTDTNLVFVDASTDRVGIGTSSPGYKLQVNGSFAASTKSFRIHHPSKKDHSLEYGSLESPYHGVRLTGRGTVLKGVGTVSLPDYLKDLIHDDDTLNIQITNIKHGKTIYIDKIDLKNDRFIVKADRSKSLGELEFFWTLSGVRKDVDHLVVEKEN
jgi:hypothetical protein